VSRIDRGKLELERERISVDAFVRHAVETTQPVIDAKSHELVVHYASEPLFVDGDHIRLSQAVSNLLNNAAKFTPPGGRIEVNVRATEREAVISVKDSGIGFEKGDELQMFDMFVQLESARALTPGGLGLGLMLVGIAFMVGELFFPVYGSLGIGGAIAFVIGSVILIDTDIPGYGVPVSLALGIAAASAAFLFLVIGMALKAHRRPVVSGHEELIGSTGEVLEDFEHEGWARVHGENWRVRSAAPLKAGERVRVAAMHGLLLEVVSVPKSGG